jgi:hypothetical protein
VSTLQLSDGRAADFEEFVKSLTLAQTGFVTNLLKWAAEGDYGVVEEFYMWAANRWNDAPDRERDAAAHEAEERFFTLKAFERYQEEMSEAQKTAERAQNSRIIIPPGVDITGGGNGKKR